MVFKRKLKKIFPVFIIASILFACGCSTTPKFNEKTLARIYANQLSVPRNDAVIFIPGMMGTVLQDKFTGRTVWGEMGTRLVNALALPIDTMTLILNRDSLVASKPIGKFSIGYGLIEKEIYDKVSCLALVAGNYKVGVNALALSYDWRRDLVEAAKELDVLIEKIKVNTANPNIKINLICHSAGGLIARYYIKYGACDVLDQDPLPMPSYAGAKNISKVIMLGTPNSGAVEAFERIDKGLRIPLVGFLTPETVFTMPSVYENLPFNGESVLVDAAGKLLKIDIYEALNWEKYGWSVFNVHNQRKIRRKFFRNYPKEEAKKQFIEHLNRQRHFLSVVLKRAKNFHQALYSGDPVEEQKRVSYIILGSDCHPTPRHALLKKNGSDWQTIFRVQDQSLKDIIYGFGDGSVTKESLLGEPRIPSNYEVFVCESHEELLVSPTYLDNIIHAIIDD
ncbi:MAG: hypothetical protein WAX79_03070 [Candidatus Omnitrophota bacterium]